MYWEEYKRRQAMMKEMRKKVCASVNSLGEWTHLHVFFPPIYTRETTLNIFKFCIGFCVQKALIRRALLLRERIYSHRIKFFLLRKNLILRELILS